MLPVQIFKKAVKGRNFMTPNVIRYYKIDNGAVELSSGNGILGRGIFGVTVVRNNKPDYDASIMFYSEEEAIKYIETL